MIGANYNKQASLDLILSLNQGDTIGITISSINTCADDMALILSTKHGMPKLSLDLVSYQIIPNNSSGTHLSILQGIEKNLNLKRIQKNIHLATKTIYSLFGAGFIIVGMV